MRTPHFSRFRAAGRIGAAVAAPVLLLTGVLAVPAGAANPGPYATNVIVSSSPTTPVTGQPVTLTAKVGSGTPGRIPGGQVQFTITGNDNVTTVTCDAGNTVALAGGLASCSVSGGLLASLAPYSVSASYTDTLDSHFLADTGTRSEAVNSGTTTTVVTSSSNPTVTGQGVSFVAAVAIASPATGSLVGSVTFAGVACDGGNSVPVAGGIAQCSVSGGLSAVGSPYLVTGTYGSDPNFKASTSAKVKQVTSPAAATVVLSTNPNICTGDVCSSTPGVPQSFTGLVNSTGTDGGTGVPNGPLVFSIVAAGTKTTQSCTGGSNSIALVGGSATCSLAAGLPAHVYYIVTAKLADPNYSGASATLYLNASLWSTSIALSVPKTVVAGETFNVTAAVTPAAGYAGTSPVGGYVNITVCGGNSNGGDGCQGGAAAVVNGIASITVGGGEYPGSYRYYGVYSGDSNFYGATAKKGTLTVTKSGVTIGLTEPDGFVSVDGAPVGITATLTTENGSVGSTLVGPPTGTVTFTITGPDGPVSCDGGNVIQWGTAPGQSEGSVSCYISGGLALLTPPETDYTVQVAYSGDSDYAAGGAKVTQVVVPAVD
jgi:hypothetical protein